MRILAVHPGADWSTADVFNGIVPAMARQGVEIVQYNLSGRINYWHDFLKFCWRKQGKTQERPSHADSVYMAGTGILERALRFEVDWVYICSGMFVALEWVRLLKRANVKIALHLSESPYDDEIQSKWAELADVVWTNEIVSAQKYGWRYLPHAYDPQKHFPAPINSSLPQHDVVFVGSGFEERVELLSAIDWTGIDLGLYGNWNGLGSRHRLRKHVYGSVVDNTKAVQLYRNAKIGLNLHRRSKGWGKNSPKIDHAESLNPRAYELAACGCFQISDWREEVSNVFGGFVPTFKTAIELKELLQKYLGPAYKGDSAYLRQSMASMARGAVQGHTFDARAQQMIDALERFDQERKPSVLEIDNGIQQLQFVGQLVK